MDTNSAIHADDFVIISVIECDNGTMILVPDHPLVIPYRELLDGYAGIEGWWYTSDDAFTLIFASGEE